MEFPIETVWKTTFLGFELGTATSLLNECVARERHQLIASEIFMENERKA